MNRRQFLHQIPLALCSSSLLPQCLFASTADTIPHSQDISPQELLGKQKPALGSHGIPLREPAAEALYSMILAARKAKLKIHCVSGFRSFDSQKAIWNRKYRSLIQQNFSPDEAIREIIQYSAIPGTSRHHWGTDVDIILETPHRPADPLLEKHFAPGGLYVDLGSWLMENANSYGFYEVYTHDPQRTGFAYEPWHWSYADLSVGYLHQYLSLDLPTILQDKTVEGSDRFNPKFVKNYIKNWVQGINPRLISKIG